jgi:CBS domain-containing protein
MKVSEYMSTITEIATPDTPLSQIAKQLATNNVSCVVIIEDKKPVGKTLSMNFALSPFGY